MIRLIEICTQLDIGNTECLAEFLMYDAKVEALVYEWTKRGSQTILDRLHALRTAIARGGEKAYRHAVASWKPGHNAVYATKIVTTKCVMGCHGDG
jgi:hypothetical protein